MMSSAPNMLSLGYSEHESQAVWWERTDGKSFGVAKDGSLPCWPLWEPQHTNQLLLSFLSPMPPSCQAQGTCRQQ